MEQIQIRLEKLSLGDIIDYFMKTTDDFPLLSQPDISIPFAKKLKEHASFVTCRFENKLVGMIAYYNNCYPLCYLTHVSIINEFRGKGLFKEMLYLIETEAKKKNMLEIELEVSFKKEKLITYYENLDFKKANRSERGFLMRKLLQY